MVAERFTGTSVRRKEDPRILSGRGNYVADVELPGMLHATFLRSPFAHARIRSIDASAARHAPGVIAVYTGDDLAPLVDRGPSRHRLEVSTSRARASCRCHRQGQAGR